MDLNRNRILDAAKWSPPQRILKKTNAAGIPIEVIEKMPGMYHERWINPGGFVVFLALGCANALAEGQKVPRFDEIKRAKLRRGWLPWGRCPLAMVLSQEISSRQVKCDAVLQSQPCTGGNYGPSNPCKHALQEQAFRQAEHERRDKEKADAYKRETEHDREQRETHHSEMVQAIRDGHTVTAETLRALLAKLESQPETATPRDEGRKR